METDLLSKMSCPVFFRILDGGQSPKTQYSRVKVSVLKKNGGGALHRITHGKGEQPTEPSA
jgi:hypothetical protein